MSQAGKHERECVCHSTAYLVCLIVSRGEWASCRTFLHGRRQHIEQVVVVHRAKSIPSHSP